MMERPPRDGNPIEFNDPLPDTVDCVIVGGGVIGVSTAWYLRKKGLSVLVLEKGRIAGEQSSRNWGWVRTTWRDPDEVPIARDSIDCWERLSRELGAGIGFRRTGVLGLTESDETLAEWENWLPVAREHGLDTRMLSSAEACEAVEGARGEHTATPVPAGDARCEPFTAVRTLAKGLQVRGGLVREACAARILETEAGRIDAVVTEEGPVRTGAVVCAAGAWSNRFLRNMDIDLPQLAVKATVARTERTPEVWPGAGAVGDLYLRRREDGGYTVTSEWVEHLLGPSSFRYYRAFGPVRRQGGETRVRIGSDATQAPLFRRRWSGSDVSPFEIHRVLDPVPSREVLEEIRRLLRHRLPALGDVPFAQTWAGMIDATPDVVPVMDEVSGVSGLFVATGFSGHGFGIGPGAGRVMARLVAGETPGYDLRRFRFSRFSDGSAIRPGPAI